MEQQLLSSSKNLIIKDQEQMVILLLGRQLKYQIYLGLSRCERKRKFLRRALEFAQLAILIDSSAYEGFYSKAHILKDLKEYDDSLLITEQTNNLIEKSIQTIELELKDLHQLQEGFNSQCNQAIPLSYVTNNLESAKLELLSNLNYLIEAKRYILKLKDEIREEKKVNNNN